MPIDSTLRRLVRTRARNWCEYCRCHQDALPFGTFHIEHVIAVPQGGNDGETNLCLACHWCNAHKGTNSATQVDGQAVPLFNPRVQVWQEHFAVEKDQIVGQTAIGRGTVRLLDMNDPDRCELRQIRAD